MRVPNFVWPLVDWSTDSGGHHWLLRAATCAATVCFLVASEIVGTGASFLMLVGVTLTLVWAVVSPESAAALALLALLGWEWYTSVQDSVTPWTLVAAVSMFVVHTSVASAATAPAGARFVDPRPVRRLLAAVVVLALTAGVWAAGVVLVDVEGSQPVLTTVAALLGLAALGWFVRDASLPRPG